MTAGFTPQEKSLRKQWLIVSLLAIIGLPLVTLGMMVYMAVRVPVSAEIFYVYFAVIALTILTFYILYRCAYKKPGIRFLIFCLIIGPLLKIQGAVNAFRVEHDGLTVFAVIFNLAFFVWWYVLSLKMVKINKRILKHD